MARREIQVFNMSFLDMMTNFLGAVIILFLLSAQNISKSPGGGVVRKVEGSYDADRLILHAQVAGLQIEDTLLVIVKDNEALRQPAIAHSGGNGRGKGNPPGQGSMVDTAGLTAAKDRQMEAIFIESASTSTCNDAGTPNANDDTYTISLKVVKTGKTGVSCLVGGKTVAYNTNVTCGPYRISDGPQVIVARDAQNATLSSKPLTINPPSSCSGSPPAPGPATPEAPGMVNFYANWEDPTDKVNIYVKKGSAWVYGGRTSDPRIGEFSEFQSKTSAWKKKNTNVETVRQLQTFIPGTYQVYLHYKGNKNPQKNKTEVPVTLWLLNKKHPGDSRRFDYKIPFSKKGPKNGGVQLLKTVEITPDGKFIIR